MTDGNPARATRLEAEKAVAPEDALLPLEVSEEYALTTEGCPSCGVILGGSLSEPPTANDPAALRQQAKNLRTLGRELQIGRISVEQVKQIVPQMCPICRATMDESALTGETAAVASKVAAQAALLEDRASALGG